MTDAVLIFSDRHSELSGSLVSPAGTPTSQYFVVVFPADRTLWRAGSRRIQSVRPASDGSFAIKDLPAGDYLIAALTDLEPADLEDAGVLDQLMSAGVKVSLGDGEKKIQDLRIAR